jgi:hypothetical protein
MNAAMSMKSETHTTTLPSGTCAVVARRFEEDLSIEDEPTAVIPARLLLTLLAEAERDEGAGGAPRFEVVELDPEDLVIEVDDSLLEEAAANAGHDDIEHAFAALTRG